MRHLDNTSAFPIPRILHNEYAGFRKEIIRWADENALQEAQSLLDPFAGTARLLPYVVHSRMRGHFNDLLPHHTIINEAKVPEVYAAVCSIGADCWMSIRRELIDCFGGLQRRRLKVSSHWMREDVIEGFRRSWDNVAHEPEELRPLFRAVLILLVRPLSGVTPSAQNRTWLKPGGMTSEKPLGELIDSFLLRYRNYYRVFYGDDLRSTKSQCSFSSTTTNCISKRRKFDVIFTSPPFPNRFDYVVTYAPELNMLARVLPAYDAGFISSNVLGTNRVSDYPDPRVDLEWLRIAAPKTYRFLRMVARLAPDDEGNYYLRYFTRYYRGLYEFILDSMDRLAPSGSLLLALQNNLHRGELNDLSGFVIDFASHNGFSAKKTLKLMRPHQGRRNISADHPLVLKKQEESIVRVVAH